MKIKSCEIKNFGKLCDKTIDFDDKITVVRGRNESGKSTLSAFIKYVLYGFSGKGRDERNNEKLKYTPWSGLKCSGAVILEDGNRDLYRAERSTDGKSSKGKILNSLGTECFEGQDAGEVFFGIDSSAFAKSSFVGQNDIEPDDMKDLGSSLEKLLLEGESDDADFDKAIKTLGAEKNKLYNKMRSTGKIFELEEKIFELKKQRMSQSENIKKLNASEFAISEAEKNLAQTNSHLDGLYAEAENIEAYRACELLEKIEESQSKYRDSEEEYLAVTKNVSRNGFVPDRQYLDRLSELYSDFRITIPEYISSERELETARLEYQSQTGRIHDGNKFDLSIDTDDSAVKSILFKAKKIVSDIKKFKTLAIVFMCLVVTIPVSVVMFVLSSKKKKQLSELLSEYGFVNISELEKFGVLYNSIYPMLSKSRDDIAKAEKQFETKKKSCAAIRQQLDEVLSDIGYVSDFENNKNQFEDVGDKLIPELRVGVDKLEKSFAEYSKNKNAYEALISVSDVEQLRFLASKKGDEPPRRAKEEVDRAIKYDEGAKALLSRKYSELEREIARLGAVVADPAELEGEICRLEAELCEAKLHTDAIELAIELIEKAREDIRGNVFPEISERAGELFSKFSAGKYRGLFFDKDFTLKVLEKNDTETRKIGYLSSGAIDTAYIALRVALAEYMCKDKPILVFDDSFAKIDDARLAVILETLEKLSEDYQIVILSCHNREAEMLGEKCKVVNFD